MRTFTTVAMLAVLTAVPAVAQQPDQPKPGPEHAMLKAREGTWATVMNAGGTECKGTTTYKMELGGLWLCGSTEVDMGGMKFAGKSLDTYDAASRKFVGVWADSMGTKPMTLEGTYDAKTKTLTSTTQAPGPDGKVVMWKAVDKQVDADTIDFKMFVGDAKEPMFTITYKRKK